MPAFLRPPSLSRLSFPVTENTIIDGILEWLNQHGLTLHQSQHLPERLGGIIEMGQRVSKETTQ